MLAVWSLVPLPFLNPACTSGSSWFTFCWSLTGRILSINLSNMWNECNCMVVCTFFDTALLWNWNENWPFPFLWWLSFPNLLAFEYSTLTASSCFRILISSSGIPSPPLALFLLMLPWLHTPGCLSLRWVITPSWLSGSLRSFVLYFCVFLPPLLNLFCFC